MASGVALACMRDRCRLTYSMLKHKKEMPLWKEKERIMSYDKSQFWKISFQHEKRKKEMCENNSKQTRREWLWRAVGLPLGQVAGDSSGKGGQGRKGRGGKWWTCTDSGRLPLRLRRRLGEWWEQGEDSEKRLGTSTDR